MNLVVDLRGARRAIALTSDQVIEHKGVAFLLYYNKITVYHAFEVIFYTQNIHLLYNY